MHILLGIDLSLYVILFLLAGGVGFLVRIDQWASGDFVHPTKESGKLDILRLFWIYTLTFILSGIAGTMVSIGASYVLENKDSNILMFIAATIGAVGRLIFYKLVEWVHKKFDDSIGVGKNTTSKSVRDVNRRK